MKVYYRVCYSGCARGGVKSVQVLLNGIEAVVVLTLIILKLPALYKPGFLFGFGVCVMTSSLGIDLIAHVAVAEKKSTMAHIRTLWWPPAIEVARTYFRLQLRLMSGDVGIDVLA